MEGIAKISNRNRLTEASRPSLPNSFDSEKKLLCFGFLVFK